MPAVVVLTIDGCEDEEEATWLRRLIATELRADGVDEVLDADPDDGAIARVDVTQACEGEQTTIQIGDLATDKRLERQVPVTDVEGDARSRVVAFAVAGLLRASWAELVLPDAPEPAREVPEAVRRGALDRTRRALDRHIGLQLDGPSAQTSTPSPDDARLRIGTAARAVVEDAGPTPGPDDVQHLPPPSAVGAAPIATSAARPRSEEQAIADDSTTEHRAERAAEPSDRWQLGATASARLFFEQPTGAVGGRVFAGVDWFRVGVTGEGAWVADTLGSVTYGLLLLDAEAQPLSHSFGSSADPLLAMRVRVSAGWLRFQGETSRTDVDAVNLDAFVFGGEVVGALRVPLLEQLALEIELSLGAMTGATARADGRPIATGEGLFGRVALGLAR